MSHFLIQTLNFPTLLQNTGGFAVLWPRMQILHATGGYTCNFLGRLAASRMQIELMWPPHA